MKQTQSFLKPISTFVTYCMVLNLFGPAISYAQSAPVAVNPGMSKDADQDAFKDEVQDQWLDQLLADMHQQSAQCENAFRVKGQTFKTPVAQAHAELRLMGLFTDNVKEKLTISDAHPAQGLSVMDQDQLQCVGYRLMDIHHQIINDIQAKPGCFQVSGFDDLSQCHDVYNWSGVTKRVSESLLQDVYRILQLGAIASDEPQMSLAMFEKQMPAQFGLWNDLTITLEVHRDKHLLDISSVLQVFSNNAQKTNQYDRTSTYFVDALSILQKSLGDADASHAAQKTADTQTYQINKNDDLVNVLGISLQSMEDAAFAIWSQAIRLYGQDYFTSFMHKLPQQQLTAAQKASGKNYHYRSYKTPTQVAVDAICETNPGQWDRPALAQAWVKQCKHDFVVHHGEKIKITTFLSGLFQKYERMHLMTSENGVQEPASQVVQGAFFQAKKYPLGKARNNGQLGYQQDIVAFNARVDGLNQLCTQVHQEVSKDRQKQEKAMNHYSVVAGQGLEPGYSYTHNRLKKIISPGLLQSFETKHASFVYQDELARMITLAPSFRAATGYTSYKAMLRACAMHDPIDTSKAGMKKIQAQSTLLAQDRYILQKQLQSFEKAYTYHYKAQYQPESLNFEEVLEYFLQYLPASALQYIVKNPSVDFAQSLAHYIDRYATEEQWHVIERWVEITVVGLIVGGAIAVSTSGTGLPAVAAITSMMALALSAYEVVRSPMRLERLYEHNLHLMHGLLTDTQPYLEDMIALYENQQSQITWEWINLALNMSFLPWMTKGAVLSAQNLQFQKLVSQYSNALKAGGYSLNDYEALIARIQNHPSFRGFKRPSLRKQGGYAPHPTAEKIQGPRIDQLPGTTNQPIKPQDPVVFGPNQRPNKPPRYPRPEHGKEYASPPSKNSPSTKPNTRDAVTQPAVKTSVDAPQASYTLDEMLKLNNIVTETPASVMPARVIAQPKNIEAVAPSFLQPLHLINQTIEINDVAKDIGDFVSADQKGTQKELERFYKEHQKKLEQAWALILSGRATHDIALIGFIRGWANAGHKQAQKWIEEHQDRSDTDILASYAITHGYIFDDAWFVQPDRKSSFFEGIEKKVKNWLKSSMGKKIPKKDYWNFYLAANAPSAFQKELVLAMGLELTPSGHARFDKKNLRQAVEMFNQSQGMIEESHFRFSPQDIGLYLIAQQKHVDRIRVHYWLEKNELKKIADYFGWHSSAESLPAAEIIANAYFELNVFPETKPTDKITGKIQVNNAALYAAVRMAIKRDPDALKWMHKYYKKLETYLQSEKADPFLLITSYQRFEMLDYIEKFRLQRSDQLTMELRSTIETSIEILKFNQAIENKNLQSWIVHQLETIGYDQQTIAGALQAMQKYAQVFPIRHYEGFLHIYNSVGKLLGWANPIDMARVGFRNDLSKQASLPVYLDHADRMYHRSYQHIDPDAAQAYFSGLTTQPKNGSDPDLSPAKTYYRWINALAISGMSTQEHNKIIALMYDIHLTPHGYSKIAKAVGLKWIAYSYFNIPDFLAHELIRDMLATGVLGESDADNGSFGYLNEKNIKDAQQMIYGMLPYDKSHNNEICYLASQASHVSKKQLVNALIAKHAIDCKPIITDQEVEENAGYYREHPELLASQIYTTLTQDQKDHALGVLNGQEDLRWEDVSVFHYLLTKKDETYNADTKRKALTYLYLIYQDAPETLYAFINSNGIAPLTKEILDSTDGAAKLEERIAYLYAVMMKHVQQYDGKIAQQYFLSLHGDQSAKFNQVAGLIRSQVFDQGWQVSLYKNLLNEEKKLPEMIMAALEQSPSKDFTPDVQSLLLSKIDKNLVVATTLDPVVRKKITTMLHDKLADYLLFAEHSKRQLKEKITQNVHAVIGEHIYAQTLSLMHYIHLENKYDPQLQHVLARAKVLMAHFEDLGFDQASSLIMTRLLTDSNILGRSSADTLFEINKRAVDAVSKAENLSKEYEAMRSSWEARKFLTRMERRTNDPYSVDRYKSMPFTLSIKLSLLSAAQVQESQYFLLLGKNNDERWHRFLSPDPKVIAFFDAYFQKKSVGASKASTNNATPEPRKYNAGTKKLIQQSFERYHVTYDRTVEYNFIQNLQNQRRQTYQDLITSVQKGNPEANVREINMALYWTHEKIRELLHGQSFENMPANQQFNIRKYLIRLNGFLHQAHQVSRAKAKTFTEAFFSIQINDEPGTTVKRTFP